MLFMLIYKLFLSYSSNFSVSKVCWKMKETQMYYGAIKCDTIIYTQDLVNFMES